MLISVVATGAYILKIGPHTRLKEYTQSFYQQFHENGFKVNVKRRIQELIFEVIEDDIQLTTEEQLNTKFFMSNAGETYCWGGYFTDTGVLLSLPHYLAYEKESDIKLNKCVFGSGVFGFATSDPERNKKSFLSKEMLESDEAKVFNLIA